ncbi:MAG: efflux RND transporter periplasmic adaptor subunit [Pseudomonadota bacterium]
MKRTLEMLACLILGLILGFFAAPAGLFSSSGGGDATAPDADSPDAAQSQGALPDNSIFVTTAEVVTTPPRTRIQSIGTGKAAQLIHITADFSGIIEKIQALPNTQVAEGDPIVTFERRSQEILLEGATAELEKQQAAFDRLESLVLQNSTAVSQAQLDEARASLALATAQVAEAQYEYDRRVVRAPFAGQINLSDLTIGSYVPQGTEIVTLVDTSSLLVEFTVPEESIAQIEIGVPVRLSTPALRGRVFAGQITAFDSSIDEEFRTVGVRAEVKNPENLLVPGMTFSVSLASAEAPLPMVPSVSILWEPSGAYVWRVGADFEPVQVPVVLRHRLQDNVWVEGALQAGDTVIKDGAFKVSQGALISMDLAPSTASDG